MQEADKGNSKQKTANVLIVEGDGGVVRFMLEILARKGICGITAGDEKTAVEFLDKGDYDLVFVGDKISLRPGLSPQPDGGFELLRKIKANSPELPVIMTGQAESAEIDGQRQIIETAVKAIRAGCFDFLARPLDRQKIEDLLDTILPNHNVSVAASAQEDTRNLYTIVGKDPKLIQTLELAKKISPTSIPVLISGESGTGKELFSYYIHHNSKRREGPYITVNCAALSSSLLESELFGHEKGAFTGAYTQRKGRFEMAHGGTLLLDEITETSSKFQAKLLRVLEQQDFERVGGNENVRVDVRVISTTNKDLLQEVRLGRFRSDLYYRLSGVRLVISPLRARSEDIPDLVWHFVNLYARQMQRKISRIDPAMTDIFTKYNWPGNVRQLRNVVLTSLIMGVGTTLSLADVSWLFDELQPLPQEKTGDCVQPAGVADLARENRTAAGESLGGISLAQLEQRAILDTLRHTNGNQARAAKTLGISDRTLRDKMRQYRSQGVLQVNR